MNPAEVNRFQLCIDIFCNIYRELFGINAETNYIQNMSAGVFRYFANNYGSIYAYNNTAMEACAGREQDYFQKATQHDVDGHRGKKLIETFLDHHMIERTILMNKLNPGTLDTAIKTGKTTLHPIRNAKIAARRLAKKTIENDGVNLKPDRIIRVAGVNAIGKRTFTKCVLQVGDLVPKPTKRSISVEDMVLKSLVKKLKSC